MAVKGAASYSNLGDASTDAQRAAARSEPRERSWSGFLGCLIASRPGFCLTKHSQFSMAMIYMSQFCARIKRAHEYCQTGPNQNTELVGDSNASIGRGLISGICLAKPVCGGCDHQGLDYARVNRVTLVRTEARSESLD